MTYIKTPWELFSDCDRRPDPPMVQHCRRKELSPERRIEVNRFREKHGIQVKRTDLKTIILRMNKRSRRPVTLAKL